MREFIKRIVFFVLSCFLTIVVLDITYSQVAIRSNYFNIESWYDLMHGAINADIVAIGNSRTLYHVDPIILDSILCLSSYNLGMDGGHFNEEIHKWYLLRKYNKTPELIIQNVGLSELSFSYSYSKEQFYPYFWNIPMRKEFYATEPLSFKEKYIPLYRYRGYDLWLQSNPPSLTKGYKYDDSNWDGSNYSKVDSITFHYSPTAANMFDEYLARNKEEGIKMVFVYAPIYIGATNKMTNQDKMYATYKKYADKYDIPILDYTYMDICYDTTYFFNAKHLNKKGAEIFSDSLANDIKKLGIL